MVGARGFGGFGEYGKEYGEEYGKGRWSTLWTRWKPYTENGKQSVHCFGFCSFFCGDGGVLLCVYILLVYQQSLQDAWHSFNHPGRRAPPSPPTRIFPGVFAGGHEKRRRCVSRDDGWWLGQLKFPHLLLIGLSLWLNKNKSSNPFSAFFDSSF